MAWMQPIQPTFEEKSFRLPHVPSGGSHCGSSWCTRYWTACICFICVCVLVVVSHVKNAHPTRNMNLSHFSLKDTWVTFVFFCQDVFIIALLLFSSSSNSLHLWISINCKNTSPLDDQLDKHKSLASGVMNIGETDHIFEDMSSF